MRSKIPSAELGDEIISRHRSGEGYNKKCVLHERFRSAQWLPYFSNGGHFTQPRPDHLGKLSNEGSLVREVTKT